MRERALDPRHDGASQEEMRALEAATLHACDCGRGRDHTHACRNARDLGRGHLPLELWDLLRARRARQAGTWRYTDS